MSKTSLPVTCDHVLIQSIFQIAEEEWHPSYSKEQKRKKLYEDTRNGKKLCRISSR